jgi:peptide/nickel transport system substrate-binding protein
MSDEKRRISRRDVLKGGAALGAAALINPSLGQFAYAASKDRVIVYNASNMDNLHPYDHSSGAIYGQWQHMMEPLVEFDYAQAKFVGRLAESWEFRGKEWEFRLRKGIKFHDGSPLTSADVAFSIDRMKNDKRSLQRRSFRNVQEVQTPDDHTVVVITKKPSVTFLSRGVRNRFIMSKAVADKYGKDVDKHPTGTGPYKFVSFKRDGDLVLERNDAYWGSPKPQVKTMVWRKVTEEAARVAALEAGQADVVNAVPAHDVERLKRNPRINIKTVPGGRIYFLALNPAFKPWDNKLVRQAANYSVDAYSIVKNIFDGLGFVVEGAAGKQHIGYDPNAKRYPYDPKKARELLAKAGYPDGVNVKMYYSAGRYPKDSEVVQAIAAQMKKGGFNIELITQEWVVFWGKSGVNGGKMPFYYISRGSVVDAHTHLEQYFKTGASVRVDYSNPEFDRIMALEQAETDPEKRLKLLHQLGRIVKEDSPWVPLWVLADIYGAASNIEWKPRSDERIRAWEMTIK